jgi:hypothetical protein
MGGSQGNPFRVGGDLMNDYTIDSKNNDLFLTYLTHKQTQKGYLLRELTFNDLREYTIHSDKIKSRKKLKNNHLTQLTRTYLINKNLRKELKITCVPISTKYTLFGNTLINLSSIRSTKEPYKKNPLRNNSFAQYWLVPYWVCLH